MKQPNTWHRGAPPSHRLKHHSRVIVSALAKRLMEVMRKIDALPDPEAEADPVEAMRKRKGGR